MKSRIWEELASATEELEAVRTMPEADVCRMYNVDSREEIETLLNEELESLRCEAENAESRTRTTRDYDGNYMEAVSLFHRNLDIWANIGRY
jgi:hypothetical protein